MMLHHISDLRPRPVFSQLRFLQVLTYCPLTQTPPSLSVFLIAVLLWQLTPSLAGLLASHSQAAARFPVWLPVQSSPPLTAVC